MDWTLQYHLYEAFEAFLSVLFLKTAPHILRIAFTNMYGHWKGRKANFIVHNQIWTRISHEVWQELPPNPQFLSTDRECRYTTYYIGYELQHTQLWAKSNDGKMWPTPSANRSLNPDVTFCRHLVNLQRNCKGNQRISMFPALDTSVRLLRCLWVLFRV